MTTKEKGLWERVREAIENSKTLTLKTITYLPRERAYIDRILGAFLEVAGMTSLKNNLSYCIHELAGNAKKANTKRLYFQEKGLDINSPDDYATGMRGFKQETVDRIDQYLERLKEAGLYVKFQFRKIRNGVRITVRNNALLTAVEERRIREKIAIAARYTCFAEAYTNTEDGTEGAGLGLVMMIFMLKSLGFGPDALNIRVTGSETAAVLTLINPRSLILGELSGAESA
ncbi:MAG: hypothetical protein ABSG63_16310 [Spirochaetia bacterium]